MVAWLGAGAWLRAAAGLVEAAEAAEAKQQRERRQIDIQLPAFYKVQWYSVFVSCCLQIRSWVQGLGRQRGCSDRQEH